MLNTIYSSCDYVPLPFKKTPVHTLVPQYPYLPENVFSFPTKSHTILHTRSYGRGRITFCCSNFYTSLFLNTGGKVASTEIPRGTNSNRADKLKYSFFANKSEPHIYHLTEATSLIEFASKHKLDLAALKLMNPDVDPARPVEKFYLYLKNPFARYFEAYPNSKTDRHIPWGPTGKELNLEELGKFLGVEPSLRLIFPYDVKTSVPVSLALENFSATFLKTIMKSDSILDNPFFLPEGDLTAGQLERVLCNYRNSMLLIGTHGALTPESWEPVLKVLEPLIREGMSVFWSLESFPSQFMDRIFKGDCSGLFKTRLSPNFYIPSVFTKGINVVPSLANCTVDNTLKFEKGYPCLGQKRQMFVYPVMNAVTFNIVRAAWPFFTFLDTFLSGDVLDEFVMCKTLNSYLLAEFGMAKFNLWDGSKWVETVETLTDDVKKLLVENSNTVSNSQIESSPARTTVTLYLMFLKSLLASISKWYGSCWAGRKDFNIDNIREQTAKDSPLYRILPLILFGPSVSFPTPLLGARKITTAITFQQTQKEWFETLDDPERQFWPDDARVPDYELSVFPSDNNNVYSRLGTGKKVFYCLKFRYIIFHF